MRPAVFFDRDDTLIHNKDVTAIHHQGATAGVLTPGDLFDPALVRLLPGAAEGCARLDRAGFALVVFTNQGAVAQGLCTLRDVEAVHDRLRELLAAHGVALAGVYYSPHRPPPAGVVPGFAGPHPWRKPAPGMILTAARELELDLSRSWAVGDAPRDMEAGIAAGLAVERCLRVGPDAPFADVSAAAAHILAAPRV